jgi:hypothetical protein
MNLELNHIQATAKMSKPLLAHRHIRVYVWRVLNLSVGTAIRDRMTANEVLEDSRRN